MSTDRWTRVEALFHQALELPPIGRAAWLEQACPDPDIRGEVQRLIACDGDEGPDPIGKVVQAALAGLNEGDSRVGQQFGPWRLVREAGRGGMGTVWVAERADASYSAQVAIKFMRGAFMSPEMARRFRAERQILADLQHPNIARLVDGGAGPDGTPYLAMEYVPGEPITDYAWSGGLDLESRLRLFLTVCGAVAYAHRSLIVHRDLKPSNILVGDDGVPKLVDFGIAKLLDEAGGDETTVAVRPMTPAYASPEQILGERITVTSDVFSLGTVLYELLSGEHPFRAPEAGRGETQRRVLHEDPALPSVIASRASEVTKFVPPRALAGDLDNILLMALRKEPEERYATVDQLADDLRRYLDGLPVRARRATTTYRVRKFVSRHRSGVAAAVAGTVVLAGTVAFYTARVADERDVAERERATAERVTMFMTDIFRDADPGRAQGQSLTVLDALDRGRRRLATELSNEPEVRARLLNAIGASYAGLASYEVADTVLKEALTVAESVDGGDGAQVANVLDNLGRLSFDRSDIDLALSYYHRAIRIREAVGDPLPLASSLTGYGGVLIDTSRDSARAVLERALAIRRTEGETIDAGVGQTRYLLAAVRLRDGDYHAALDELRVVRGIRDSVLSPMDPAHAATRNVMAVAYAGLAEHDSARMLYEQALEQQAGVFGPDHPRTATALNNLSTAMMDLNAPDSALALLDRALQIRVRSFGEDNPDVAATLMTIGAAYANQGDREAAIEYYERARGIYARVLPPDHRDAHFPAYNLGVALNGLGRYREAEEPLRDALRVSRAAMGPRHQSTAITLQALGVSLTGAGDTLLARDLFAESLEMLEGTLGPEHPWIRYPLESLAEIEVEQGRFAEATELYESRLPVLETAYATNPAALADALAYYARALRGMGRDSDAEVLDRRVRRLRD